MEWWKTHPWLHSCCIPNSYWLLFQIPLCLWIATVNSDISLLRVGRIVLLCISLLKRHENTHFLCMPQSMGKIYNLIFGSEDSVSSAQMKTEHVCIFSPWNGRRLKAWKFACHLCMYNVWKIYFRTWILLRFPEW